MNTLISNYVNGNLSTAKAQAKRKSYSALLVALQDYGYGPAAAIAIAAFLKGRGSFQAACDAEHAEKVA